MLEPFRYVFIVVVAIVCPSCVFVTGFVSIVLIGYMCLCLVHVFMLGQQYKKGV